MPLRRVLVCIGTRPLPSGPGFLRRAGGEARSASSHAEKHLHPEVVEAMRELGIDLDRRVHQLSNDDVSSGQISS